MRVAYFDCFSGAAGDMVLGALLSAGAPRERLLSLPARLGLGGVSVQVGEARRGPFVAVRVEVSVTGGQPHRHLSHLERLLEAGDLTPAARDRARQVFRRLAQAEAEVHGSSVEQVHFHEVGAADALVDVVGSIELLEALGVEEVYASALPLGRGSVRAEHGAIPVPAPATALLLRGAPVEIPDVDAELVTPTGAALLSTLVRHWGPPPAFTLQAVGTGAGARDLGARPNVLRVLVGEAEAPGLPRHRVAVLETALDDENPQFVSELVGRLLERGALDAMVTPTQMKKGRAGLWLVALAEPERAADLARLILAETSTLGVRTRVEERFELERRREEVETPFGRIGLKVARLPGGGERAVPEFEDVRRAAERAGRSLREVAQAALRAWKPEEP